MNSKMLKDDSDQLNKLLSQLKKKQTQNNNNNIESVALKVEGTKFKPSKRVMIL